MKCDCGQWGCYRGVIKIPFTPDEPDGIDGRGMITCCLSAVNKLLPMGEHKEMSWAQRLKRVFNIDVTICSCCGGAIKIIASIEDPFVIKKILDHLNAKSGAQASADQLPEPRAPPQTRLFD